MRSRAELIKNILEHGYRILTSEQFTEMASKLGYSKKSISQLVFGMKQAGFIETIKPGLFQLSDSYLNSPVSAYEVGLAIVPGGYLSHLSAITIHHLTDQLANIIYVSVELSKGRYSNKKNDFNFEAKNCRYKILETSKSRIFGVENKWLGDYRVRITDLERTLIDCINSPQYCGGFYEVLSYFDQAKSILNLSKIIDYASRMSNSCMQRLGWCFDKIFFIEGAEEVFQKINTKTMVKLDSSGYRRGIYNKKWKIIENI